MRARPVLCIAVPAIITGVAGFLTGQRFPVESEVRMSGAIKAIVAGPALQAGSPHGERSGGQKADGPVDTKTAPEMASPELLKSLNGMVEEDDLKGVYQALGQSFMKDPQWLSRFLEKSPHRDEILRKLTTAWARKNSEVASAWLAAHQDGHGRDAMAAGLAVAIAGDDRDAAAKWVTTIKDPAMKLTGAQDAGYEFFRESNDTARGALAEMGLPDSSAEAALQKTWHGRLERASRRNAQNVASAYAAAMAAGGEPVKLNTEAVIQSLNQGINGSGQFATSVFKIDLSDLTARELTSVQSFLGFSGDSLSYTGTAGDP